jgi:hypothetical protein
MMQERADYLDQFQRGTGKVVDFRAAWIQTNGYGLTDMAIWSGFQRTSATW